jgi:hypothetical protein
VRFVWLERLAIGVASLLLAVVLIALLSGYFTGRDQAAVSGGTQIGRLFPDQGNATLAPGRPRPAYNSDPPTSGPHVRVPVPADGLWLSDDQLLTALAAGNVVVLYGTRRAPAGLGALARSLAGPFTPALAAAGLAVIGARRPGTQGLVALAWRRMLRVSAPDDSALRAFIQEWLGRGASRH